MDDRERGARVLLAVDRIALVLGALVGTFPVAILVAGVVAAHLPLAPDVRFPLAYLLAVPVWVTAICAAFLARRGWQLWLAIAVAIVGLSMLVPEASLFSTS